MEATAMSRAAEIISTANELQLVMQNDHSQHAYFQEGNYLAVEAAFRKLRSATELLTEFEEKHRLVDSSVATHDVYIREKAWKQSLTILQDIGDASSQSFNDLFRCCTWLPASAKDMAVDLALEAAKRLSAACTSMVEKLADSIALDDCGSFQIEALEKIALRALDALAEHSRWSALGYRKVDQDTIEAVFRCYLAASKLLPWGPITHDSDGECVAAANSINSNYLYCRFLQNLDLGALKRSEVVKVCLVVQTTAAEMEIIDEPPAGEVYVHIDGHTGDFSLVTSPRSATASTNPRYFKYAHLHHFFAELQSALDVANNKHCRRWLTSLMKKITQLPVPSARAAIRHDADESCRILMNYMAVVEHLRASQSGKNNSTSPRLGTVLDYSETGCCVMFGVGDYRRPSIGKLMLIESKTIGTRLGIVRWLKNADCTDGILRQVTAGIEFIGENPTVKPVKATSQWPSGLFVENVICMEDPATPGTIRMIEPIQSTPSPRTLIGSSHNQAYEITAITERGTDFEVASCSPREEQLSV